MVLYYIGSEYYRRFLKFGGGRREIKQWFRGDGYKDKHDPGPKVDYTRIRVRDKDSTRHFLYTFYPKELYTCLYQVGETREGQLGKDSGSAFVPSHYESRHLKVFRNFGEEYRLQCNFSGEPRLYLVRLYPNTFDRDISEVIRIMKNHCSFLSEQHSPVPLFRHWVNDHM